MESTNSTNKLSDYAIYAPSSYTERSYASNLSVSHDGKWMAYCVANVVVLRSLEDFNTCKIFQQHKVKTSAVGFSPNGDMVASGDIEGNIKIWLLDNLSLKKEFNKVLSAKICGVEWGQDSLMLFIFGDGKQSFAKTIFWDTGNNAGEITGHSKLILSGDINRKNPFKLVSGSEDFSVNFYEGVPYKIAKINKEHTNFVTGVKFSPDGSQFVSVGFDKKINIYDGVEGNFLYNLAMDKSTGNHTMAIIGVCWIDCTTIATSSLDKTVKIWDLNEKVCKFTLLPKEKTKLGLPEFSCGINTNGKYVFSLSLSGILNFWDINSLQDEKLPDRIIDGHQNYVSSIVEVKSKNLVISSDNNGKIIIWKSDSNEYVRTLYVGDKKVVSMGLSCDESSLYVLWIDGVVNCFDLESGKQK
jgi:WD repeat-containing protein 1 (actin-interacting protein 1)